MLWTGYERHGSRHRSSAGGEGERNKKYSARYQGLRRLELTDKGKGRMERGEVVRKVAVGKCGHILGLLSSRYLRAK